MMIIIIIIIIISLIILTLIIIIILIIITLTLTVIILLIIILISDQCRPTADVLALEARDRMNWEDESDHQLEDISHGVVDLSLKV